MDKTEVRTPRTAPISCPFESVVEGTAKKWRNNSYVPSIKCTSMWSPIGFSESDVIRSGFEFGDHLHVADRDGIRSAPNDDPSFCRYEPGPAIGSGLPVTRSQSCGLPARMLPRP